MGVLDRLDREARESRQRREAAASARSRQAAAASTRLAPAVERARIYLERLATRLNEVDWLVEARYALPDVGVLAGLRQESYRVGRGDEGEDAVRLHFSCNGSRPVEASIDGHHHAQALARKLREVRLSCHLRPLSRRMMQLRVEAKVPVRVDVVPDVERETLWIELRNLPDLGVQRYAMAPERVDEALLEALASLVLREPSAFAEMTGSVVHGSQRDELRRRLAREQRRRDVEVAGGLRRRVFPVLEWFRRQFLGG